MLELDGDHHRPFVETTEWTGGQSTTTHVDYTTDSQRHHYTQLQTVGGATVARTFDVDGRLTSHGTRTFQYDASDHLSAVHDGGVLVASYRYDAFGRRRSKTVGNVTTRFVNAGPWLLEEYQKVGAGAEQLEARHYYSNGVDDLVMSQRRDPSLQTGRTSTTTNRPPTSSTSTTTATGSARRWR